MAEEDNLDDIMNVNGEEDGIPKKGDLCRHALMKNSISEPYVRAREMGKQQFADRREIRETYGPLVFDKVLLDEYGMHLVAPPLQHHVTPEQVQPDDGRRTRSQGIAYKF